MRFFVLTLVCLGVLCESGAAQAPFDGFDAYVIDAMALWKVPGLAVSIVQDDRIVYAKGYGVRTLGSEALVDDHTIFAIGSSSKSFTAASVGVLVDSKELSWNDAVFRHLPEFELYDSYASHEMTVRDLLSHRGGLARGDLMWYGSDLNRNEIVRRVRFLEPAWSFRSQFGYQNIMYLTAGQVVERLSGMSWDQFVTARFFEPLGMSESNTSVDLLSSLENVASPHAELENEVQVINWRNIDNIGPAGSINSNVLDMAQWVRLHLNDGEFEGSRILSSAVVQEMQQPNTIVQRQGIAARLFPAANFQTYGMGWFLQDHRSRKLVQHGGNIDGMSAMVALMPSENVGVVILTNMNGTSLRDALMLRIMDAYVGVSDKDWSTDIYEAIQPLIEQQKEQANRAEEDRVTGTTPTHDLDAYTGTFVDPDSMYGEVEVHLDGDDLRLTREPAFVAELEHWHYNTYRATWIDPMLGKSLITFSHSHEGTIDEIAIQGIGTFERKPEVSDGTDAVALSETQLRAFVGRYSLNQPPLDLSIEFLDGRLQAVLPGQPAYVMATVTETSFRLTGIPINVTMDFEMQNGEVTAVVLTQQGTAFTLLRVR